MTRTERFWRAVGGRKTGLGLFYALLITVMVFPLHGDFQSYAMFLATALLGTSAMVAHEDTKTAKPFLARRAGDPPAPEGAK